MKIIISLVILTLSLPIWCRPQTQRVAHPQTTGTAIPIISQSGSVGVDGSFNYTYETGNGIHVQEGGYLKKGQLRQSDGSLSGGDDGSNGDIQVIVGAFAYKSPDGTDIQLQYTADENGFHPVGEHLPTPPPIPPAIQRALSLLPQSEQHESQQTNVNVPYHPINQQSNQQSQQTQVNVPHYPLNQQSNNPFNFQK